MHTIALFLLYTLTYYKKKKISRSLQFTSAYFNSNVKLCNLFWKNWLKARQTSLGSELWPTSYNPAEIPGNA